jgi:carboxypeptidase family protein
MAKKAPKGPQPQAASRNTVEAQSAEERLDAVGEAMSQAEPLESDSSETWETLQADPDEPDTVEPSPALPFDPAPSPGDAPAGAEEPAHAPAVPARVGQPGVSARGSEEPAKPGRSAEHGGHGPEPFAHRRHEHDDRCRPPEPEPEIVDADEESCEGVLRVHVVESGDDQEQVGEDTTPVPGAGVSVSGTDLHQVTDADGDAVFEGLELEHSYEVRVEPPEGYDHVDSKEVTLEQDETVVTFEVDPVPARVRVVAFLDANHTGDPAGQPRVNRVTVDFLQDDQSIGCGHTSGRGVLTQEIPGPAGLVQAVPRSSLRVNGRVYRYNRGPITMQVVPGGVSELFVPYSASLSQIQLAAYAVASSGDKKSRTLVPGVRFELYEGHAAAGPPIRQSVSGVSVQTVFSDLAAGDYLVKATWQPPLKDAAGRALELARPKGGQLPVTLSEGQSLDLTKSFLFQPAACRITGRVLDSDCGTGVPNVAAVLLPLNGQGEPIQALADADGQLSFPHVPPGRYLYTLLREKIVGDDGSTWVPAKLEGRSWVAASAGEISKTVDVGASSMQLAAIRLVREEHKIYGMVLDELDQTPVPHAVVEIQDEAGEVQAIVTADAQGNYAWIAPEPGQYFLAVRENALGEATRRAPVRVNQPAQQNLVARRAMFGFNLPPRTMSPQDGGARPALEDLTAYPILTENIDPAARSAPVAPGGAGAPLQQVVGNALLDVLGRKLKTDDPQAFLSSLNRAFSLEQVEGRTQFTWTPRTYAVQTELGGGITGAQASIYHRAKVALDDALPLLDGLEPLLPDYDEQEVEAARSIVRTEFIELVNELGLEGGPRVQRVDDIFNLLLRQPGGQLDNLRIRFGLDSSRVVTVEEEQNLTNFLVIADYVRGLRATWSAVPDGARRYFTGTGQKFLGTQLVLLSRTLSVVAESVDEANLVMDSVFIGPAERQTLRLNLGKDVPSMLVEELMSWVTRFATEEAPTLIQDGGLRGVEAIVQTAGRLEDLVRGAEQANNVANVAFMRPRVRRALHDLAGQLGDVRRLAEQLSPTLAAPPTGG